MAQIRLPLLSFSFLLQWAALLFSVHVSLRILPYGCQIDWLKRKCILSVMREKAKPYPTSVNRTDERKLEVQVHQGIGFLVSLEDGQRQR